MPSEMAYEELSSSRGSGARRARDPWLFELLVCQLENLIWSEFDTRKRTPMMPSYGFGKGEEETSRIIFNSFHDP